MNGIIVCVKQVPKTGSIKLDPVNHTLIREGVAAILNPFDEYALDAALCCKEKYGVQVTVVTMGPAQAKDILLYGMEKGADDAFLLSDTRLAGSDTLVTAKILHKFISMTNYRAIFCGLESVDSSTGHIGPSLAELFHVPQITHVREIFNFEKITARVIVDFDTESKVIDVQLPAVFCFGKKNTPIRGKVSSADERQIKVIGLNDLEFEENAVGLKGSPTRVVDIQIDEHALNYLIVDSELHAFERIRTIMDGGVKEKKNRILLKGSSEKTIDKITKAIKSGSYKSKDRTVK